MNYKNKALQKSCKAHFFNAIAFLKAEVLTTFSFVLAQW